ncbi:MAG: ATP-binding protein [Chlamydiia bacterium]|nr:ATP-binding protein [Chlamydiia bacterium]
MKAWSNLLLALDHELGKETVDRWLRTLKILKFDAGNLYLDGEDTFHIHWFNEYVLPLLPKKFVTLRGKPIRVHLSIKGAPCEKKRKEEAVQEEAFRADPLEPHATFEETLTPSEKNLPYALLSELTQNKLSLGTYNPIYIHGPKGSGKSHLLMATAHALKSSGKSVFYVNAATFTDHVIRAFRSTSLHAFRKTYRAIEILLIDDVHLLSRKTTTQEELFHTFNRLHTAECQIILSSSCPPPMLEEIEQRLVSRFEWGITLALPPPSIKERTLILRERAKGLDFPLSEELEKFLTSTFSNLHSLIEALVALALRLPHGQHAPDLEIGRFYLKDLIEKEQEVFLTPEKLLKIVAHFFGIKTEDLSGRAQHKECALPRQIAMYFCREKLNLPYLKIGRLFSRDHSTVITSVKRIKKGIEKKEEGITLPLQELRKQLN